ncbi:hypothetical protein EBZ38_11285, partial [bacterium]|nr:hypothetical protein [bacterium]NDD84834.1 hypothetical protein [bacterium]
MSKKLPAKRGNSRNVNSQEKFISRRKAISLGAFGVFLVANKDTRASLMRAFNSTEPPLTAPQSILPTMEPVANSKEWLLNANYKDVVAGL